MFNGQPQTVLELIEEVENGTFDKEILKLKRKFSKHKKENRYNDDRESSGDVE